MYAFLTSILNIEVLCFIHWFFLNIKFNNNTKQKLEIISGYTNLNKIIDFESKKKICWRKKVLKPIKP